MDEVRLLDNSNALIFIRGEKPIMDKKFDILSHPDIKSTEDGGAKPYKHNKDSSRFKEDISFTNPETVKFIEFKEEENQNDEKGNKDGNKHKHGKRKD